MTRQRVRLYLDVDGVLNAEMPLDWGTPQDGHAKPYDTTYLLRWAPAMIEELNKLDVDLVWTTTWRSHAELIIAPLMGITLPSRVLHPLSGVTTFPSINWKMQALIADQRESPSPFLWVDDEIGMRDIFVGEGLGGLAISSNPVTGITVANVADMQKYIAAAAIPVAETTESLSL